MFVDKFDRQTHSKTRDNKSHGDLRQTYGLCNLWVNN